MVHTLDRASLKAQCRELLQTAQVSPKGLTALYCGLSLVLNLVDYAAGSFASNGGPELLSMFASVFTMLAGWILATGFALYCMGIRQREIMDYGTLFDGFSFTGKLILLALVRYIFVFLWSMLFIIPGIVKSLAWSQVPYLLAENPGMSGKRARELSDQMTMGHKWDLFVLGLSFIGWNLLGALACGVGVLFVAPYVQATYAEAYAFLRAQALEKGLALPGEFPGLAQQR